MRPGWRGFPDRAGISIKSLHPQRTSLEGTPYGVRAAAFHDLVALVDKAGAGQTLERAHVERVVDEFGRRGMKEGRALMLALNEFVSGAASRDPPLARSLMDTALDNGSRAAETLGAARELIKMFGSDPANMARIELMLASHEDAAGQLLDAGQRILKSKGEARERLRAEFERNLSKDVPTLVSEDWAARLSAAAEAHAAERLKSASRIAGVDAVEIIENVLGKSEGPSAAAGMVLRFSDWVDIAAGSPTEAERLIRDALKQGNRTLDLTHYPDYRDFGRNLRRLILERVAFERDASSRSSSVGGTRPGSTSSSATHRARRARRVLRQLHDPGRARSHRSGFPGPTPEGKAGWSLGFLRVTDSR